MRTFKFNGKLLTWFDNNTLYYSSNSILDNNGLESGNHIAPINSLSTNEDRNIIIICYLSTSTISLDVIIHFIIRVRNILYCKTQIIATSNGCLFRILLPSLVPIDNLIAIGSSSNATINNKANAGKCETFKFTSNMHKEIAS